MKIKVLVLFLSTSIATIAQDFKHVVSFNTGPMLNYALSFNKSTRFLPDISYNIQFAYSYFF